MQKEQAILTKEELKVLEADDEEIWFIFKQNNITLFVMDGERL